MSDTSKAQPVTALLRGLDILSCFDRPRLELTVSEIARRVALSQPTTWRLCQTLQEKGYLVRSTSGKALRIGAPSLALGYAAIAGLSLVEIALPLMQEVTDSTHGTTSLSRRQGHEMIAIERVDGAFIRPNEPIGWRASLATVAGGIAVLAALPADARRQTIAELAQSSDKWESKCRRIEGGLRCYAEMGYVRVTHSRGGDYTAIAVPLFEDGANPADQWAMTCGEIGERWNQDDVERVGASLKRARSLLQPALPAIVNS